MSKSNTSILVVDDQPDNVRALSKILQSRGYQVRQATSGQVALRTANSQPPDLILLDIRMPQMDGYAVCAALKQSPQTREIPVIFLSALGDVSDKVRAFDMGGVDYITKPFQIGEVLARIDNQLHIQQQKQQVTNLLHQMQQLNTSLEQQIQAQTLELQQALEYERTLKRISDRVRDSLDKTYILQATVEELARVLEAQCCDTVLFNRERSTETFCLQSAQPSSYQRYDSIEVLLSLPGVHDQLEQGTPIAFCRLSADPSDRHSANLGCPIRDDSTWLGTLWIFKPVHAAFTEQEVRLVDQVANQCAIALRQARLYEEAQIRIIELHRLNQLKDDFLSTISHELRTPVANMRMVLQLLMMATEQGQRFLTQLGATESAGNRIAEYFRILQEECEREISLIQDLLDLQHLEADARPLELVTLDLNDWLLHILEVYEPQTQNHQQQLVVQLSPNLPPLLTDVASLTRIVTELLDNACKYTPPQEAIAVTTAATASYFLIRISNSGVTIAPAEQSRIFDKFYRIPNNDPWRYKGTGLGLALAQKLATHLGGALTVSSSDNWTRFTLQLPLSP